MSAPQPRRWLSWSAVVLCAIGCGTTLTPAFDSHFVGADSPSAEQILARLAGSADASVTPSSLLVATTHAAQPELIVYDLGQQRVRWRTALRADTRPEVLGDLVLTTAGGRLIAFEAASGQRRFSTSIPDCTFLGAARDAERVIFTCDEGGHAAASTTRSRLVALDAHSGRTLWQRQAPGKLGRPAATADLLLVPWQGQSLAVLDARDGRELLRLRSEDDIIDWVRADAHGVLFGSRNMYRLGAAGYAGRRDAAPHLRLPGGALPGDPAPIESAFVARPGTRTARGRVAVYLQPEPSGADAVRIAGDVHYFVFYRYVFGYDASGALRFARMLPHDVIAGRALADGLLVATDQGQVLFLSQNDGALRVQGELGAALASATLGTPPSTAALGTVGPDLRHALTEIALDADNRLVPARAYAVRQLAALDDPEVTRELLDIYGQTTTPPELARVVADVLRTRRTGLEHLIDALASRYDLLEQTRPAPMSVIIPALVDAGETRAVPRLVERFLDHETPTAVLPAIADGLAKLGDRQIVAPLLAWLRLYRADSSLDQASDVWMDVARAVSALAGESGPNLLAELVADGHARPAIVEGIAKLQRAHAQASAPPEALVLVQPPPALPATLSQEAVNATFAENIDELRACISDELGRNPRLSQVRIAFIAEHDGSAHAFAFAPNTQKFVDCIYPSVANRRFPAFRAGRSVASYVIALRPPVAVASVARAPSAAQPWWAARAALSSETAHPANVTPWWHSQQLLVPIAGLAPRTPATAPQAPSSPPPADNSWWRPTVPASAEPTAPGVPQAAPSVAPAAQPSPGPPASDDAWWQPAAPKTDEAAKPESK